MGGLARKLQKQDPVGQSTEHGLSTLSFSAERRLWLQVLHCAFLKGALQDLGPLIWSFLDNHPRTVRLCSADGHVWDISLHHCEAKHRETVAGDVLGFLHEEFAYVSVLARSGVKCTG